jgi:hypothetical protein
MQYVAYKVIFQNLDVFKIWHDRLGHPRIGMMQNIISNSLGHHTNTSKFPKPLDFICVDVKIYTPGLRVLFTKLRPQTFEPRHASKFDL